MIPSLLGLLLLAAPAQPQVKLAAPGLAYVNLPAATGDFYLDYFAKQIELHGVRVTTNREIAALIGLERQRALLSCDDKGNSCLAELAGALGVDGLITGSLAKVSRGFVINIKVVDNQARSLAVFSERFKTEDALLDFLGTAAEKLAGDLQKRFASRAAAPPPPVATTTPDVPKAEPKANLTPAPETSTPEVVTTAKTGGGGLSPWVPGVAGGALAVAGGVMLYLAKGFETQIRNAQGITSYTDATRKAENTQRLFIIGDACLGAGAVGLGLAGVMAFTGAPAETPKVTIAPTGRGAALAVGGTF